MREWQGEKAIRKIVVKVGTSTLTHPTGKLNLARIEAITREISDLVNAGHRVVLVTSGAIGAGLARLGWSRANLTIPQKQACAAVGQSLLMQVYEKLFSEYGHTVAQVLLTRDDFADRRRYLNARHTLSTLLEHGVVPIINENDTVAIEELRFGDNDTLSALVASLLGADLLIILTDIDGLFTADPRKDPTAQLIHRVEAITPELVAAAGGAGTSRGTGGMVTKLHAAEIATSSGIGVVIANGGHSGVLHRILAGEEVGTYFLPQANHLGSRQRWIAFNLIPAGELVVDDGASQALVEGGKSLLPSGVVEVRGEFAPGDAVKVLDLRGQELARGLVNYSSSELSRIKGHKTSEIEQILGYKGYDEVIHRDNLVLTQR